MVPILYSKENYLEYANRLLIVVFINNVKLLISKGPSTKDVRQNLGFSNHPPPLVWVCPNFQNHTPPGRPRPDFSIFTHFSIFTYFYFCSLKQSLLHNSCFYKV